MKLRTLLATAASRHFRTRPVRTPSCSRRYLLSTALLYIALILSWLLFHSQSASPTPSPRDLSFPPAATLTDLTIEIFSAPRPFASRTAATTIAAIRSWKALHPRPKITLVGHGSRLARAAAALGVDLDTRVDTTFLGVPLFNSLVALANRCTADVAVIVNADTLLFDDFVQTLRKVAGTFRDFLVVGARYNVGSLPENLPEDAQARVKALREHMRKKGALRAYGGMAFWAWNTRGPRLYDGVMPPFIFRRGKYDNWFTHEIIAARRRAVVDVSETCLSVHLRHDYVISPVERDAPGEGDQGVRGREGSGHDGVNMSEGGQLFNRTVAGESVHAGEDATADDDGSNVAPMSKRTRLHSLWPHGKMSKFELFLNIHLSLRTGTYINGLGTTLHTPWKMAACHERAGMCLIRRCRPGICYCEYSSVVNSDKVDPWLMKKSLRKERCVQQSVENKELYDLPVALALPQGNVTPTYFGLPLTVTEAIDNVVVNNTVIISALNYGYRFLMMNWVCNMRRLQIKNFVIAALDPDLYRYAYTKGIATYYEDSFDRRESGEVIGQEGRYGSVHFKKLTKMKTQVVARISKLGYNVVWTDCDVMFFKNPLPYMWAQSADLVIQSNAPDGQKLNGRRRINSGFYLAQSKPQMIKALGKVIRHALRSRNSEQPCFYDILCGLDMEYAVGDDTCNYNGVRVKLLDRSLFPNGATRKIWDSEPGTIQRRFPNLYVLHNNWVVGIDSKRERLKRHGFIMFDSDEELCNYGPLSPAK